MPVAHQTAEGPRPRRRADAERSIARILDAAVDALGDDQEASMAEIARRAGVVRATIYVHFPTREALLEAVTERADALARVVTAAWRKLGRYHALVAINTSTQTPEQLRHRHGAVLGRLLPLVERGQAEGAFRGTCPPDGISRCSWRSCTPAARRCALGECRPTKPRRHWWPPSWARSRAPRRRGQTRRS